MRAPLALLLTACLALPACGGGDDNSTSGPTGSATAPADQNAGKGATGATGATDQGTSGKGGRHGGSSAGGGSAGRGGSPSNREKQRRRALSRRPRNRTDFTGTANVVYHEARSRCLVIPLVSLKRGYGAASSDPVDVARAYARREAPVPAYRRAAQEGCLDGINSRP